MSEPRPEDVEQRLSDLELEVRLLKGSGICAMVLVVMAFVVLLSVVGWSQSTHGPDRFEKLQVDTLEAGQVVVSSKYLGMNVTIGQTSAGTPAIVFNERDKPRMAIQMTESGLPAIHLNDAAGVSRMVSMLSESGEPSLYFVGEDAQNQLVITAKNEGGSGLEMEDKTLGQRASLSIGRPGLGANLLLNVGAAPKMSGIMLYHGSLGPRIDLDDLGVKRVALVSNEAAGAGLMVKGKNGGMATLLADPTGDPAVTVSTADKRGRSLTPGP